MPPGIPAIRTRRPKYQTSADNPVLPNGSYGPVLTSPQQQGNYGAQGQFGAMLPARTPGLGTETLAPIDVFAKSYNKLAGQSIPGYSAYNTTPITTGYQPYGVPNTPVNANIGVQQYTTPAGPPANTFNNPHMGRTPLQPLNADIGPGAFLNKTGFEHSIIVKLAQDPNSYNTLPQSMKDAIDRQISGGQQTGPDGRPLTAAQGGNTDYAQTKFAQEYAAKNTPFERQKRWDPERKKFVELGTLIKEGRLNIHDYRARLRGSRHKGGGGGQQQAQPGNAQFVPSFGVVNFNTATG